MEVTHLYSLILTNSSKSSAENSINKSRRIVVFSSNVQMKEVEDAFQKSWNNIHHEQRRSLKILIK